MSKMIHGVVVPKDTNVPDEKGIVKCRARMRCWANGDKGFELISHDDCGVLTVTTYREGVPIRELMARPPGIIISDRAITTGSVEH